ncbi:hypothetical protein [Flammeovirga sp. OC4]|uniref:hypothetical protein n=1 Tax=Flammeovirga sp. OC4 TaxID=1382345 RepID=UPI0005C61FEA|nr:hypothetical protein [Flammeovirga sp. OC4]
MYSETIEMKEGFDYSLRNRTDKEIEFKDSQYWSKIYSGIEKLCNRKFKEFYLSKSEKDILIKLVKIVKHKCVRVFNSSLAKAVCVSVRTVSNTIKKLNQLNLIQSHIKYNNFREVVIDYEKLEKVLPTFAEVEKKMIKEKKKEHKSTFELNNTISGILNTNKEGIEEFQKLFDELSRVRKSIVLKQDEKVEHERTVEEKEAHMANIIEQSSKVILSTFNRHKGEFSDYHLMTNIFKTVIKQGHYNLKDYYPTIYKSKK